MKAREPGNSGKDEGQGERNGLTTTSRLKSQFPATTKLPVCGTCSSLAAHHPCTPFSCWAKTSTLLFFEKKTHTATCGFCNSAVNYECASSIYSAHDEPRPRKTSRQILVALLLGTLCPRQETSMSQWSLKSGARWSLYGDPGLPAPPLDK